MAPHGVLSNARKNQNEANFANGRPAHQNRMSPPLLKYRTPSLTLLFSLRRSTASFCSPAEDDKAIGANSFRLFFL